MELLLEHARLATRMFKNNIKMDFLKDFTMEDINNCCNRLENNEKINENYKDSKVIQRELIRDENAVRYIIEASNKELDLERLEYLIKDIKKHNEKLSDYTIEDIIEVINNNDLYSSGCYDYLKYYINSDEKTKKIVSDNLNHFYSQSYLSFDDLNNSQRELFKEEYLCNYNLIPTHNELNKIYEYLSTNGKLNYIINFLYKKKLYIPLTIYNYKILNDNTESIADYIEAISNLIQDNEVMYMFLLKWLENECKLYDLKIMEYRVKTTNVEQLKEAFFNRSTYINFIYGDKLKNFPLEEISENREELIIYAIANNKKSFLKLITQNIAEFLSIPTNSILYQENFYSEYINLNELTLKNLIKLQTMYVNRYTNVFKILEKQTYTFEEISTLYNVEEQYIYLYNKLLDLKIDDRLLRIRQFIKKDLLIDSLKDSDIEVLARRIKIRPLYKWLEECFNNIKDIKAEDIVKILIHYNDIIKFIPQIKNKNELAYVLRNYENIQSYDNLADVKNDIELLDKDWYELKRQLDFSPDFMKKYKDNIKEFLLNNGAELAYKYYKNRNDEQKEAFKLIIKAELMGQFKSLKYHTDDLSKEIDYKLNTVQIEEWTNNNRKITEGIIEVQEYDDFYNTMILGEKPQHTCLSYINGMYNRCLLACFDSNKKILYAKRNNKIVARAMVRLTKGTYNSMNKKESLSFIDVENNSSTKREGCKEKLTLFLERLYIAEVSCVDTKRIVKLFMELLEDKAEKMNALLVLSNYYEDYTDDRYVKTKYYMYISRSKSSSQYLDSLSGQATISDEGGYKSNNFLILKR